MALETKTLFLFDVDGTLISSGGAGGRALTRACLSLHGIDNASSLIKLDGKTDRAIVREILHEANLAEQFSNIEQEIERTINQYLANLPQEVSNADDYQVLPGIQEFIGLAKQDPNICLALATGNVKRGAEIKLSRANLFGAFDCGGFGCDSEQRPQTCWGGHKSCQKNI